MPMFTLSIYQLLPLLVIVLLLMLQQRAIKKGQLVKVQYSKAKRLFWALLSAALVAVNAMIFNHLVLLLPAVVIGLYLYYFKQYYALQPTEPSQG
jgi:asparagine N-glycosylation enzyme membrane subunit Stt3